jgi:hypothetical protein
MVAALERAIIRGCRLQMISQEELIAIKLGKELVSGLKTSSSKKGAIVWIENRFPYAAEANLESCVLATYASCKMSTEER